MKQSFQSAFLNHPLWWCVALVFVLLTLLYGSSYVKADASGPLINEGQGRDELRIQLTDSGFVPSATEHAAGTFAIAIENSTISDEYLLRLKAEDGTVLKEVSVQKGSSAWTVSLATGNYTITEANNPNWICRLTVQ